MPWLGPQRSPRLKMSEFRLPTKALSALGLPAPAFHPRTLPGMQLERAVQPQLQPLGLRPTEGWPVMQVQGRPSRSSAS